MVGGMCSLLTYMALVFAIVHLYAVSSCCFFNYCYYCCLLLLLQSGVDKFRRNDRRYRHVLAFCALLTGVILKGTNSSKMCVDLVDRLESK